MRKETRERDGTIFHLRYYDNWLDFVSYAERVERDRIGDKYGGMSCASVAQGDSSWRGTKTLAEAITFARKGWLDGISKMRDVRRRLNIKKLLPHTQRIYVTKDVTGDEPDIDLFLQGEPENMVTIWERQMAQRGKVFRFVLNRTALGGVGSDMIIRRGVGLVLVFEVLFQLGYSAEITICFSDTLIRRGNSRIEWYVPVLHAGDPINLDTLAFMFIQPAVMRRLRFAASECESKEIRNQFGYYKDEGYGKSCDPLFLPDHDLFLKWEEGLVREDEQIVPFALGILNRLGIELAQTV